MNDSTAHPALPKAPPIPPPGWVTRWLLRRPPLLDVLVVKTRTCPLCEEAVETLEKHRKGLGLRIRLHDITGDPDLLAIYGHHVPVVFIEGRQRFFGHVDDVLLRRTVAGLRQTSAVQ